MSPTSSLFSKPGTSASLLPLANSAMASVIFLIGLAIPLPINQARPRPINRPRPSVKAMMTKVEITDETLASRRISIRPISSLEKSAMSLRKPSKNFLPRASPIKSAMSSMVLALPILRRSAIVGSVTSFNHPSILASVSWSNLT